MEAIGYLMILAVITQVAATPLMKRMYVKIDPDNQILNNVQEE